MRSIVGMLSAPGSVTGPVRIRFGELQSHDNGSTGPDERSMVPLKFSPATSGTLFVGRLLTMDAATKVGAVNASSSICVFARPEKLLENVQEAGNWTT